MLKRTLVAILLIGLSGICRGQVCTSTHTNDLYCLLPAAYETRSGTFAFVNVSFGTELSQLPSAKPAGVVLVYRNGGLQVSDESLGAIFTEGAQTIGRHRLLLSSTYQYFGFSRIDGTDLHHIPLLFTFNGGPSVGEVYTQTNNRYDIKANQYTALGVFGLTDSIDVSVTVPFERIAMSAAVQGAEYAQSSPTPTTFYEYLPGSSSGFSDVILGSKWKAYDQHNVRLAPGVDVRIPSGDEYNFLGSGTIGVKPYLAVSLKGHVAPHGSIGYQWNGDTVLNANSAGAKQQLPTDLFYTAGVNADVAKRFTIIGDILCQHFFSAPRLPQPSTFVVPNLGSVLTIIQTQTSDYTVYNGAVGVKVRVAGHLILTANGTAKLDNGGLRAKVVPLVGLSYSF